MIPPRAVLRLSIVTAPRVASYTGAPPCYIHTTGRILQGRPAQHVPLSRENAGAHRGDPSDQAVRAGLSHADKSPLDAALKGGGKKASRDGLSGNPEGVGFADQVGGASAMDTRCGGQSAAAAKGMHGTEDATPPGVFNAVKSALAFEMTSGELKQNRGGGEGVTGAGTVGALKGEQKQHKRAFYTSAPTGGDRTTTGQVPDASRHPRDHTYSEQNEHLKHHDETDTAYASQGKGNAAENPSLPSHKFEDKLKAGQNRRSIHTSAPRLVEKHSAESYFKEIDETPPQSSKTHQVDSSDNKVVRPNEQVSGETKEYATVDKDRPYDTQVEDEDAQLRYGGVSKSADTVSKPGEGPEGEAKGGRVPERK